MLTSRRDYMLRIIDEVGEWLARIVSQRTGGRLQDALPSVVEACERLFSLESDKLFRLTPEQQFARLIEHESPDIAAEKVLLYAALNAEAGKIYTALGNQPMARGSLVNALRLTLKTGLSFPHERWPAFAPRVPDLLDALKTAPLDAETAALLERSTSNIQRPTSNE